MTQESRLPPGIAVRPVSVVTALTGEYAERREAPEVVERVSEAELRRHTERAKALEPYKTEGGYNLAEAIRGGHSVETIAEMFGDKAAVRASKTATALTELDPYETETGYDVVSAIEGEVSEESLSLVFSADALRGAHEVVVAKGELSPYVTEAGYDVVAAIEAGIPDETLSVLFDESAVEYAHLTAEAKATLQPYETEEGYNIASAIEAGVAPDVLETMFTSEAVEAARLYVEAKEALAAFETTEGYDIVAAIEADVDAEVLSTLFESEDIGTAEEVAAAKETLSPYVTEDGYNVAAALEAGVADEVLAALFAPEVVEQARTVVEAREAMVAHQTDEGYDVVSAIEAGVSDEQLSLLFDSEVVDRARSIVVAKEALEVYEAVDGYDVVSAVEAGVSDETLSLLFTPEVIGTARETAAARGLVEPYRTEEGYDIVSAIEAGVSEEALLTVFGEEAIRAAHEAIETGVALEPYRAEGGYDIIAALEAGVTDEVLTALFSSEVVERAHRAMEARVSLEPYRTEDGYDVVAAIEADISDETLALLFTSEAVEQARDVVEAKATLEPYQTEEGYNIVAAIEAGVSDEVLASLFAPESVEGAREVVAVRGTLSPYLSEGGYDIIAAVTAGVPDEQLSLLFAPESISTAHEFVVAREALTPHEIEEGYNIVGAVRAGVSDEVLTLLFGVETVESAHRTAEAESILSAYAVNGSYDLIAAIEGGVSEGTLSIMFPAEVVAETHGMIEARSVLESYRTEEGYNLADAVRDGVSDEILSRMFWSGAIASAKTTVTLAPFVTEMGYDILEAVRSGVDREVLESVFGEDIVDSAVAEVATLESFEGAQLPEGGYDLREASYLAKFAGTERGVADLFGLEATEVNNLYQEQALLNQMRSDSPNLFDDEGHLDLERAIEVYSTAILGRIFGSTLVQEAQRAWHWEGREKVYDGEHWVEVVSPVGITTMGNAASILEPYKTEGKYDLAEAIASGVAPSTLIRLFGAGTVAAATTIASAQQSLRPYVSEEGYDLVGALRADVSEAVLSTLFSLKDIETARSSIEAQVQFERDHVLVGEDASEDKQVWIPRGDYDSMPEAMRLDVKRHGLDVLKYDDARQMFDRYMTWGLIPEGAEFAGEKDGQPVYHSAEQVSEMNERAWIKYWEAYQEAERLGVTPMSLEAYQNAERDTTEAAAMEAYREARERAERLGVNYPSLHTFLIAAKQAPELLAEYIESARAIEAEYHAPEIEGGVIAQFWAQLHHNIESLHLPRPLEFLWKGAIDVLGMPLQFGEVIVGSAYKAMPLPKAEGFAALPGEAAQDVWEVAKGTVQWFWGMPKRVFNDPLGEGIYTAILFAVPVRAGIGKVGKAYKAGGLKSAVLAPIPGSTKVTRALTTAVREGGILPRAIKGGGWDVYKIKVPKGFSQLTHELDALAADKALVKEIFGSELSKKQQVAKVREMLNPETRGVYDAAMSLIEKTQEVNVPKAMYRVVDFADVSTMPANAAPAVKSWFLRNVGDVEVRGSFADWVQTKGIRDMWRPADLDINIRAGAKLTPAEAAVQLASEIRRTTGESVRVKGAGVEVLRKGAWEKVLDIHSEGAFGEMPYEWKARSPVSIEGIKFEPFGEQMTRRGAQVLAPGYGEYRGLVGPAEASRPWRLKDVYRFEKTAEVLTDVLRERGKYELVERLEADLRTFREAPRGRPTPVIPEEPLAYEHEFLRLVDEIQRASLERGTDITFEHATGALTRVISPAGKTVVGTVYHATTDIRPYVRGAKRGYIEAGWYLDELGKRVKAPRAEVFLSPEAALDRLYNFYEGAIPEHAGIVAVRTVMGDIGKGKAVETAFRVTDSKVKKKSIRVIEDELIIAEGNKMYPTNANALSLRPKSVAQGLTGETFTYHPRTGGRYPVLWYTTEAAHRVGLGAPSQAQIYTMNLLALKASLSDLLHPHLPRRVGVTREPVLPGSLIEFYRETWRWKEKPKVEVAKLVNERNVKLAEKASEQVRRREVLGERFVTAEDYARAVAQEMDRIYLREVSDIMRNAEIARMLSDMGTERFREMYYINLSDLAQRVATIGLGAEGIRILDDLRESDFATYSLLRGELVPELLTRSADVVVAEKNIPSVTVERVPADVPVRKFESPGIEVASEVTAPRVFEEALVESTERLATPEESLTELARRRVAFEEDLIESVRKYVATKEGLAELVEKHIVSREDLTALIERRAVSEEGLAALTERRTMFEVAPIEAITTPERVAPTKVPTVSLGSALDETLQTLETAVFPTVVTTTRAISTTEAVSPTRVIPTTRVTPPTEVIPVTGVVPVEEKLRRPERERDEDEEERKLPPEKVVYPTGSVAWRQGLAWIVVKPPYTVDDMKWSDTPPEGVYVADTGVPSETVRGPNVKFTVPVGMFDVAYSKGMLVYSRRPPQRISVEEELAEETGVDDFVDSLSDPEVAKVLVALSESRKGKAQEASSDIEAGFGEIR